MRNTFKALFAVMIMALFIFLPASSHADWHGSGSGWHGNSGAWHGHDGGWHGRSYIGVNLSVWPDSYYYGAPYYPYPPDDAVLVSAPVDQPVIIDQTQPVAPVITTAGTVSDAPDSITINIPNNKGGYTAVTLKKSGNGYIGPQGEFYPEFPTVAHLKVIYGK